MSSQTRISTFFSNEHTTPSSRKRKSTSPIDLTNDSDNPSPVKKSKTRPNALSSPSSVKDKISGRPHERKSTRERRVSSLIIGGPVEIPENAAISDIVRRTQIIRDDVDSGTRFAAEPDGKFRELLHMFSLGDSKGDRKSKGKSVTKGGSLGEKTQEGIGSSGQTFTPLEEQILQLKKEHPGVLLMIEVGYKCLFYGDDAQTASRELGIACFPKRNFMTAMIPLHRRDVHLKKLLSQGYRVGIVQQTETAALKEISDNRNAPFNRNLTHLYTAATYVDELESTDHLERYSAPSLMCLVEARTGVEGSDESVRIGIITISPSTGDVVWDDFEDTAIRGELETRIVYLKPTEILIPRELSARTKKMIKQFNEIWAASENIRIESLEETMSYTAAFSYLEEFDLVPKSSQSVSAAEPASIIAQVSDFPKGVIVALAHAIKYLSAFDVAKALGEVKFFKRFMERSHMLLNSNTLANLEIFRNVTDAQVFGSLLWVLDHTKTRFGARLLKEWIGRPLIDMNALKGRADAIEEILASNREELVTLRDLLKRMPDLAKGLSRIQYGKCSPQELAKILPAFQKVAFAYPSYETTESVGFKCRLLNDIIYTLPHLKVPMQQCLGTISLKNTADGKKDVMWTDPERYPNIADLHMVIQTIEVELVEELESIRKLLKRPSLTWTSVAGDEYVIEVKKDANHLVPLNWYRLSSTKTLIRYHTPIVKQKIQELARCRESLDAEANSAFSSFLNEISQNYYGVMRNAVNKLAIADCLLSFAHVALQDGYVRPTFVDEDTLVITDGRHPMAEAVRTDPFVPNTCKMGEEEPRSKIITGPNMGGKSSCVRMIALLVIMAQVGSYVPAASMSLGMVDSVLVRMGATDELLRRRSTFMVEMAETSDILHAVTDRSLVILDELGRGTSTFDGMAIASATLEYLSQTVKCKTLFVTHYPLVATELERKFPQDIQNLHMGFKEETRIDGIRELTFLYQLTQGIAQNSFGIECARLAGIQEDILRVAAERADSIRREVGLRKRQNEFCRYSELLQNCLTVSSDETWTQLRQVTRTIYHPK